MGKRKKCPSSSGISAFTFLNFAMGAMSLAANVVNNINSNNNNNNNNNIANINIGNNNNAGNNMNVVAFMPMNGRKFSKRSAHYSREGMVDLCGVDEGELKTSELLHKLI